MLHSMPIRLDNQAVGHVMVKLTINGHEITADPSQTILQVCREQKIDNIPTLCYDDRLPPFGSCFLCVVEMEGTDRLFPSCATKVTEGMKIQTRSEKVKASRKTCLELLLSDHYASVMTPPSPPSANSSPSTLLHPFPTQHMLHLCTQTSQTT